jgi:hypothetical protein
VMQDVRSLVIPGPQAVTVATVYGTGWGYLVPISFCLALLAASAWFFRRESPWFAERA